MAQCDGCDKQLIAQEGFLFYSSYAPPNIGILGNQLLCESCTEQVVNERTFSDEIVEYPPTFGFNTMPIEDYDKKVSEGIISTCRKHGFNVEQAKNKAKELANLFWEKQDDGLREALLFWKSKTGESGQGLAWEIAKRVLEKPRQEQTHEEKVEGKMGSSEQTAIQRVHEFVLSARLAFDGQGEVNLENIGIDQTDFKAQWDNLKDKLPSPLDLSGANFTAGFFPSMNLTEAILTNTTFSNCILVGGFWENANLSGARFIDTQIKATFFNDSNFSNATFENTIILLFSCARSNFTGAVFDSCKIFIPCGLELATWTDTVFKDCEIVITQDGNSKAELLAILSEKQKKGITFLADKEKKHSGCFIATEIYKDFDSPEVLSFRKFRESYLKKKKWGKLFIKYYYLASPYIVKTIRKNFMIRKVIKIGLDTILRFIR